VGTVTSPTLSPTYGPIGLAVVQTSAARAGATVTVPTDDGPRTATIGAPSVYDPEKHRPRS
jgi:glycine cleavage system aminomethyltransferase T